MVLSNLSPQPFIYFPQSQPPGIIVSEGSCVPLLQTYNVIGQANALLLDLQLNDIRRRFTLFPGNPSIILELYTLLKNYPNNINVSLLLAEIQYSLGFPQVAIDTLQHIIQNVDPTNIKARLVLGKIYKLLNIPALAQLIFHEILKLAPNAWEALEELYILILDNQGTINDLLSTFRFVEACLYTNLLLVAPDKTRKLFDLHARSAEFYMLLDDTVLAYNQIDKALTLAFGGTSLREMISYALNHAFLPGSPIPLQMRHPDEISLIRAKLFPHTGGRLPAAIAYTSQEEQAQFLTAVVQLQLQLVELIVKKPTQINKFIQGIREDNLTHLGILILYLAIALQPHPLACRKLADLLNTVDARQAITNAQGIQSVYTGQLLAAEYYKKAYEFNSKDVKSCKKFAKCLFKLHHYQDALTIYESLYRSMPVNVKYRKRAAQCNLGLAAQSRLAKSPCKIVLAYCERALDIDPQNLMAWCSYWNHATHFCDWRGRSVMGRKPGEYWYVDDQNKLVRTPIKPSLLMETIRYLRDIELEQGSHFGHGIINRIGGLFAFLQNITSGLDPSDPLIKWLQKKISAEGWTETSQPFKNEGGWILRICDKITKHVQRRWYIDSYGSIAYAGQFDNRAPIQITDSTKPIYKRPKIPSILPEPPNTGLDPFSMFTYNLTPRQVRLISHRMALEVSYKIYRYDWLPEHVIPPPPPPPVGGRLKIGYVSGDLRHHALGILMQSVFGFHDRTEFEVYGYALWDDEGGESEVRKKIKAGCDHWFEVSSDLREDYSIKSRERAVSRLVEKIHEDGIHILFNLNGYTAHDLNELFAVRVAPIQVAHSFAASCGSGWMDYFIGDKIACPPTVVCRSSAHLTGNRLSNAGDIQGDIDPETIEGDWVFTEKLIYMPHSYFVNDHKQTMTDAHHNGPEETWRLYQQERFKRRHELFPWMNERTVILACFNQLYKLDPATFRTWLNILIRCPTAYLWLVKFADSGDAFENLKQTATEWAGPDVSNRIIATSCAPPEEHIARGCVADLFLDTPQVNAHTTACDILWPGTPILTLPGEEHRMASRVACSVANAAFPGVTGSPRWQKLVTKSLHEYEERAVELVQSLQFEELANGTVMVVGELIDLKRILVLERGSSRLFDTERWVRNLEKGLKEAWVRWVSGTEGGNIEIVE